MMHLRLPNSPLFRDLLSGAGRLRLPGGRLLPVGLGLAVLVALAGALAGGRGGDRPAAELRPEAAGRPASRAMLPGPVGATIVRVSDGDTLAVTARIWLDQDLRVLVRLRGVDAPETDGACAAERTAAGRARDRLAALSGGPGARVTLTRIASDKYQGRVIADVAAADGADLAAALLGDGLVRPYRGGRRGSWCSG